LKSKFFNLRAEDSDGSLLRILTLLALLFLLLLFLFGPGYRPAPSQPRVEIPPAGSVEPLEVKPAALAPARAKARYIAAEPALPIPPVATSTPMPTPTPAGGGILRKIAFASNRTDGHYYQLFIMDADGHNLERLTESQAFDRDPHFSYDGTRLAFSSNRDKGVYQIYVLDLDTRAIRQLTFGGPDKTNPFWSPDNSQLLCTIHKQGSSELAVMRADGSDLHQLTNTFGDSHGYGFSPDGREISYESTMHNRNEIFILDLKTRQPSMLIETDEVSYRGDPVFSPLGDKLVFSSDVLAHNQRQLYIFDLNWRKYYRVTDDDLDKDDPIFSPDGSKIAYIARWENAWNIFVMDSDGKHARNLTKSYYDHVVPTWR